ncbi:MAG: hypothetical protein [Olavius algarvensis Gamma 3 endosymbiont]|nr:MAG: hypothetical protein [Olavius algarvensis Gamma 3 endosymbiont]
MNKMTIIHNIHRFLSFGIQTNTAALFEYYPIRIKKTIANTIPA